MQASLIVFLSAVSFILAAQSSIEDERITFVRLTAEQYRNSIRDGIAMAKKVKTVDILELPVPAAEVAQ